MKGKYDKAVTEADKFQVLKAKAQQNMLDTERKQQELSQFAQKYSAVRGLQQCKKLCRNVEKSDQVVGNLDYGQGRTRRI